MNSLTKLLVAGLLLVSTSALAQSPNSAGHFYFGGGASALALDNDRLPNVPTSSFGHSSKTVNLLAGYQFNDWWAVDARLGTAFAKSDVDVFAINGYRFFNAGSSWRPFVSAGVSAYSLDDRATDDSTTQAQVGLGVSGDLNRNLMLRIGYQNAFTLSGESYQDNEYSVALVWHFRKPQVVPTVQPEPSPAPAAAPVEAPRPAPVYAPKPDRN